MATYTLFFIIILDKNINFWYIVNRDETNYMQIQYQLSNYNNYNYYI